MDGSAQCASPVSARAAARAFSARPWGAPRASVRQIRPRGSGCSSRTRARGRPTGEVADRAPTSGKARRGSDRCRPRIRARRAMACGDSASTVRAPPIAGRRRGAIAPAPTPASCVRLSGGPRRGRLPYPTKVRLDCLISCNLSTEGSRYGRDRERGLFCWKHRETVLCESPFESSERFDIQAKNITKKLVLD